MEPSILRYEPDPQTRRRKIHFYANRTDITEIVSMLQGTSDISLRVIDWFVTNYAKTHSTAYILNGQEFLVYRDYKSQLKAYSKKLFDPFCRRERIYFQVPKIIGGDPCLQNELIYLQSMDNSVVQLLL